MKHHVFFFFTITSFLSHSMQQPPILLLESREQVCRRNAHEVQEFCLGIVTYLQRKYPDVIVPMDLRDNLHKIGQSLMTTEEKTVAIKELMRLKTEIKNKHKREKEDDAILAQFGLGYVNGRQDWQISRIR